MILLDTHVWFWAVTGSSRLKTHHRKLIESQPTDCALCAATVWEFGTLVNRGRIRVNAPPREWLQRAHNAWPLTILAIEQTVALRATEINLDTGDPIDHLIAACALIHGTRLATLDGAMVDAPWLDTI